MDEVREVVMSSDTNAVAVSLQRVSQCDEWLHITTTANNLDDNVEPQITRGVLTSVGCRVVGRRVLSILLSQVNDFSECFGDFGVKININTSIY